MSESYISVSQINMYLKNIFEAEVMLQNICVYGEVGSYSISGGNAYFNLKDENGMLACVLFGASKFDNPKIGDMVLVRGSISYYAKGGKLSFNAVSIMPYGRGLLYEKFLQLKNDLEKRGYFAQEHKKPIPDKVRRIGVVSSQTGAVIRDIIDVTHRRNDTIDIVLYPVKVQGLGADREIACGIDFFSNYQDVDVVIVARGGGSMEDLEPFNSEIVATAAYNCNKPLVSAVGHETDFTIIDFVADLRAPTPSAAAEIVAWDKSLLIECVYGNLRSIEKMVSYKLQNWYADINTELDRIDTLITKILDKYKVNLDKGIDKLSSIDKILDMHMHKVDKFVTVLETYNPSKISSMGYVKVLKNNKVITSIRDIEPKDVLTVSMIDGRFESVVEG